MASRYLHGLLIIVIFGAGCQRKPVPTNPPAAQAERQPITVAQPAAKPESIAPLRSSPFWEAAAKEREPAQERVNSEPRTHVPLPKPQIDDRKVAAAGIRRLQGRRLLLYTDIPPRPEIDDLCELADQAYPQWCAYFQAAETEQPDWQ